MEVFNKIHHNLNILSEITLEDMFPSNIYYPNQKAVEEIEFSFAENEENNFNSSNKYYKNNFYSKKLNENNIISPEILLEENLIEVESDNYSFDNNNIKKEKKKLNKKQKADKLIKNYKKLHFPNLSEIWDIILDDEIIAFCGKSYIKVFFFKSSDNKQKQTSSDYTSTTNSANLNINEIDEIKLNNTSVPLSKKKSNSTNNDLFEEEITFSDKNEEFYCLSQSCLFIEGENCKILAVGGTLKKPYLSLIGHRNEIYDLKFHPIQNNILLSASKDYSIRIWNITNGLQIAILGGPKGHSAEVLSIDWHSSGDYFVSSSIDNTVKIWEITENIKEKISQSNSIESRSISFEKEENKKEIDININKNLLMIENSIFSYDQNLNSSEPSNIKELNFNTNDHNNTPSKSESLSFNKMSIPSKKTKNKFKTLITTIPLFSCKTIHENYVDSVKFNGNFVLSKSIDGIIKEWLPIFNKESDYHLIINSYIYEIKELVWYMKIGFDVESKIFATGNTQGKLFIFKLNEDLEDEIVDEDFDYYNSNLYIHAVDTGVNKVIRSVAVYGQMVACGNSDGSIYLTQLNID